MNLPYTPHPTDPISQALSLSDQCMVGCHRNLWISILFLLSDIPLVLVWTHATQTKREIITTFSDYYCKMLVPLTH